MIEALIKIPLYIILGALFILAIACICFFTMGLSIYKGLADLIRR